MDNQTSGDTMDELRSEISKKSEQAEELVTEGISKIRSKMAPAGKKYGPPKIPKTPSPTINNTLKSKCDKTFDNPLKYIIAWSVCATFATIVNIYKLLNKDHSRASYKMWLASCGIAAVLSILFAVIFYYIMHAGTFILHVFLFYACIVMAVFGIGLSASGALFFDKEASKAQ